MWCVVVGKVPHEARVHSRTGSLVVLPDDARAGDFLVMADLLSYRAFQEAAAALQSLCVVVLPPPSS